MEENRILDFRRDPHTAARTVLKKVHFIAGPNIHALRLH